MKFLLTTTLLMALMTLAYELHSQTISTHYEWHSADLSASAKGTIRSAELNHHGGRESSAGCEVLYIFTSRAGTFHESSLVNYLGEQHDPFETCQKCVPGKKVSVFYDPKNPDLAALELTGLGWEVYLDLIVILLISLALSIVISVTSYSGIGADGGGYCGGGGSD